MNTFEGAGTESLLVTLVAAQFLIHAIGWAMVSQGTHSWRGVEGHFAAFWFLFAAGVFVHAPLQASTGASRAAANLLLVAALACHHRAIALYWRLPPRDGLALLAVGATGLASLLTHLTGRGGMLRAVLVHLAVAAFLFSMVAMVWRHGRSSMPRVASALAEALLLLGLALLARLGWLLHQGTPSEVSLVRIAMGNLPMVTAVVLVGGFINLAHIQFLLNRLMSRLLTQAETDTLTGVLNRRGLLARIQRLHGHGGTPLPAYVVLMIDIDHFKAINDHFGHAEGDRALVRTARVLADNLRLGDVVARWGGEEFCVLLPRTSLETGALLAARLHAAVADSGTPQVTVSIGVAEARAPAESAEDLLRRADAALYRAKEAGRNRVERAP